jgi:dihydrofolate synthase/folylpolyglutamate synthase
MPPHREPDKPDPAARSPVIDRLLALEFVGIKLGLENIEHLCRALGSPERTFRSVHVAGTNGKGSVTAMAHEALRAAGHRSARYTSPHLSELRERFVINDAPVSDADLDAVARDVLDCGDRLVRKGELLAQPTFFEATTAMAFELFRRAGVDVAVIEVGLGGRFDATNVLTPEVGAITSIGFDHQQYLGNTIEAIAFEKAGIIKPGMTLVTGSLPREAIDVVGRVAREQKAHLVPCFEDTSLETSFEAGSATIAVQTPHGAYGPVTLGLRGEHQVGNAVVAVRVLESLARRGLAVPRRAVEQGLSGARWPARLEIVEWPDRRRRLIIDAAHNPDGARALAAHLARWHQERPPLVVGLMRDKDAKSILEALLPVTSAVAVTAAPTRRAMPAEELAECVRALAPDRTIHVEPAPADAIERAFSYGSTVCVAGSIFLAGAVRDVLRARAILR